MFVFYNENCPNFFNFLLSEIPKAMNDKKIWDALLIAAFGYKSVFPYRKESEALAKTALLLGFPPVILPTVIDGFNTVAHYNHLAQRRIEVNWNIILKFESAHKEKKAKDFMLASVLHEIVHYLDFFDNDPQDFDINGNTIKKKPWAEEANTDQGHIFEEMAFDTPPRPFWL